MPKRPRNPRVLMKEHLASIKRYAGWLHNAMSVPSTVGAPVIRVDVRTPSAHDRHGIGSNQRRITVDGAEMIETTYSTYESRKRRPDEYPEADSQAMINAFSYAQAIIVEAQRVADIARRQYESMNPGMTLGYDPTSED